MSDDSAARSGPSADQVRKIGTDPVALEAFYTAHYADVVRFFTCRLRDPHDVADLVADTFLGAVAGAARFDPRRGRPLAWLLGIAHNTLRRFYRQRETDQRALSRFAGRRLLDDEDIARLEEQIAAEQRLQGADSVLRLLSPADRELVELVDVAGLTPKEAALVMGLPAGVVRVRLFRARARVRDALNTREEAV